MPISDVQHFTGGISTLHHPGLAPAPLKVEITCGALTHPGKVREKNEDHFLVARLAKSMQICQSSLEAAGETNFSEEDGYLMVVADGMGGAAAGERASALAVASVKDYALNTLKWFLHVGRKDESALLSELQRSLEIADKAVVEEGEANARFYGMGTTLTMAYSVGADLYLAHAGDSRAYLFRNGKLEQITNDHTLVQLMISGGVISAEDARHHARRNVVTNVIGGPSEGVHAEIHKIRVMEGDVLLLCSDGLTEPVEDDKIAEVLGSEPDPEAAAQRLIDLALENGGPDNITAVVARYSVQCGEAGDGDGRPSR